MSVLVFGFEHFGKFTWNPSKLVAEKLTQYPDSNIKTNVATRVLPTEYVASWRIIQELITDLKPLFIVGLGVASSRSMICLERFALNLDDCSLKDNAGVSRKASEIDPEGSDVLQTSIDLVFLLDRLKEIGISAIISNHAGTFVCNHIYYLILRLIQKEQISSSCMFVHLPITIEEKHEQVVEEQSKAIICIIDSLLETSNPFHE